MIFIFCHTEKNPKTQPTGKHCSGCSQGSPSRHLQLGPELFLIAVEPENRNQLRCTAEPWLGTGVCVAHRSADELCTWRKTGQMCTVTVWFHPAIPSGCNDTSADPLQPAEILQSKVALPCALPKRLCWTAAAPEGTEEVLSVSVADFWHGKETLWEICLRIP